MQDDVDKLGKIISEKERRKVNALTEKKISEWSGLGMFGMVGWSVTVSTLLGTLGGLWLDKHYPQTFSWTITCLILGLVNGCFISWRWIMKQD
jgi:ATP synthase protein I